MMEKFLKVQEEQNETIKNLTSEVASQFASQASQISQLFAHGKMLENQITSQASTSNFRQPGKLPSQPENPREQVNAIMLRSGKQLPEVGIEKEEEEVAKDVHKEERQTKEYIEEKESKKEEVPKNFTLPLPFPQRQQRTRNDKHFGKFLKAFQQLKLNIPILNVINTMPAYAKFLKDIISHKQKWEDHETILINEECSAVI